MSPHCILGHLRSSQTSSQLALSNCCSVEHREEVVMGAPRSSAVHLGCVLCFPTWRVFCDVCGKLLKLLLRRCWLQSVNWSRKGRNGGPFWGSLVLFFRHTCSALSSASVTGLRSKVQGC